MVFDVLALLFGTLFGDNFWHLWEDSFDQKEVLKKRCSRNRITRDEKERKRDGVACAKLMTF